MSGTGRTFSHMLLNLLHLEGPHSQTTSAERDALRRFASARHRAVEIGVYEGVTTRLLAEAIAPDGVLYAIDPFPAGRVGVCWSELIARRHVRRSPAGRRVRFLKLLSWEACQRLNGRFDFVFIDGDHSPEGISRDWTDWAKRVTAGGVIALHDTQVPAHNPAVAQLGSYLYFESHIRHDDRFEMVDQVDSLTLLRRKGDPAA